MASAAICIDVNTTKRTTPGSTPNALAIENSRPAKRGATVCAYVCTPADVKALKASAAVSSIEAPVALTALAGSQASNEIKRMGSARPV